MSVVSSGALVGVATDVSMLGPALELLNYSENRIESDHGNSKSSPKSTISL